MVADTAGIRRACRQCACLVQRSLGPSPEEVASGDAVAAADPDDNIVDGYGRTPGDARARALENAERKVEELLYQRFGDLGWMPAPELLSRDFLLRCDVVISRGEPTAVPGVDVNDEKAMKAEYKVELTGKYLEAVQREVREQCVRDRQLILARVLGGLVVLLLVVAGYLRLEDMTRGYATTMLRLGAFGVVALAGAALWLTR